MLNIKRQKNSLNLQTDTKSLHKVYIDYKQNLIFLSSRFVNLLIASQIVTVSLTANISFKKFFLEDSICTDYQVFI